MAAVVAAFALAGCDEQAARIERSQAVKDCGDGTLVGQDPKTGRYVFTQNYDGWHGDIAPGVTPDEFCKSRQN